MTQTPQLPPNEPEPLDDAERELARALRSLPSALPPPELDARILGAARRAAYQSQPRKLRWGRSLGIGTAASALLAIGLFVKLHGTDGNTPLAPTAEPANAIHATANLPTSDTEAAKEVEGRPSATPAAPPSPEILPPPPREMIRTPVMSAPVPASAPMPMRSVPQPAPVLAEPQPAVGGTIAAKPSANAFPAPPAPSPPAGNLSTAPAPIMTDQAMPASVAAPAPPPTDERAERKTEAYEALRQDAQDQAAAASTNQGQLEKDAPQAQAAKKSAPAQAGYTAGYANPSGPADMVGGLKAKNLDRVETTETRIRRSVDDSKGTDDRLARDELPSIDEDMKLAPSRWIARIRARVKADDGDAARESLRRFRARYPDAAIPNDLRPLLD